MTIREWLEHLGLEKYASVFETEEVDVDVMPSLTEEDLVTLGIPLGPRRKIQRALSNLRTTSLEHIEQKQEQVQPRSLKVVDPISTSSSVVTPLPKAPAAPPSRLRPTSPVSRPTPKPLTPLQRKPSVVN